MSRLRFPRFGAFGLVNFRAIGSPKAPCAHILGLKGVPNVRTLGPKSILYGYMEP